MTATDVLESTLARAVRGRVVNYPGKSGLVALQDGRDAFAARILLADVAEHTLDVQYYIWHDDITGTLLLDALRRAADRGVRVRLLLDDSNTSGLDALLAAVDRHPNIEVKLFNPFFHRRWRIIDYLTAFARVNRRMHNKSFTADGQVTIVGGRNVGDEYFGAGHDVLFVDLDVLAIGPVVDDMVRDFERYWISEAAHPAGSLLASATPDALARVADQATEIRQSAAAARYAEALNDCGFVRDLVSGELGFEWAPVALVSDDPAKALGKARDAELLWTKLRARVASAKRQVEVVSPYFVPGADGVLHLSALARTGVKIRILTNAVEATDVTAVHAGYAKRRKPLLEAGIALFEMKRVFQGPKRGRRRMIGSGASSRSSLHAKTFSVDGALVFIGSFNFDPRSARLNTELGFLIESPALADEIVQAFSGRIPGRAYEVGLDGAGALQWSEESEGKRLVHRQEPGTSVWLRTGVWLLARLPMEWLL